MWRQQNNFENEHLECVSRVQDSEGPVCSCTAGSHKAPPSALQVDKWTDCPPKPGCITVNVGGPAAVLERRPAQVQLPSRAHAEGGRAPGAPPRLTL